MRKGENVVHCLQESKEKKIHLQVVDASNSNIHKHATNNDHKVTLQDPQLRGQFTRCMEKTIKRQEVPLKHPLTQCILWRAQVAGGM